MSWRLLVRLVDQDVADALARRGLEVFAPRLGWTKLILPVLLLAIPIAFLEGSVLVVYASLWGVLTLSVVVFWFWRFSIAQNARMNAALQRERVGNG